MRRTLLTASASGLLLLVATACGGDDSGADQARDVASSVLEEADDASSGLIDQAEDIVADLNERTEDMVDDMRDSLEELQDQVGGGGAELTIGGETWTFGSVLCAFGPEQIGDPEAEFVLSALQDGLQLYVSIDGFGQSVELADVTNFEDPSVGWTASDLFGDPPTVVVDGKSVRAEGQFYDMTDDMSMESTEGSLTATCP